MLAVEFSIFIVYLAALINGTHGQTCAPAIVIPARFSNLCFSIPIGAQDNNECNTLSSCNALAWFQPEFFDNAVEVYLESVVPSTTAAQPPSLWLKLDIYLNANRPSDYITLECADNNANGQAHIDAQDVTVLGATGRQNTLKLRCDYTLTPLLTLPQRVAGSFDSRNKHYLNLSYGHFTNSPTGVNDVKNTDGFRVSQLPLYQFQAGIGTGVNVAATTTTSTTTTTTTTTTSTTTTRRPIVKVTISSSQSESVIWPVVILVVAIAAIMVLVIAFLFKRLAAKKRKTAPANDKWTPRNHTKPSAFPVMVANQGRPGQGNAQQR